MKIILLIIIRMYWLIPKSSRRKCLFKETCSQFVYQKTINEGFLSGIKSLKFRIDNCNSNYSIVEFKNKKVLVSKTKIMFNEEVLNPEILK